MATMFEKLIGGKKPSTTNETPATPTEEAKKPKLTTKQMLGALSAKHEVFTYVWTKQGDFLIVDSETGRVARLRDMKEQVITWMSYGTDIAFLEQKNGKTTLLEFDGKALTAHPNLDNVKIEEREGGEKYLLYTDPAGDECEEPLVSKPTQPTRKKTSMLGGGSGTP